MTMTPVDEPADLVDEEPGGEEDADAEEDEGEVREDGRVDWRHVAREGVQGRDSHGGVCNWISKDSC